MNIKIVLTLILIATTSSVSASLGMNKLNFQGAQKRVLVYQHPDFRAATEGATGNERRVHHFKAAAEAERFQALMKKVPDVVHVEEDMRLWAQADVTAQTSPDPYYPSQWHYFSSKAGIDLPQAWELSGSGSTIVVAVLDTGVLPHPDIINNLLPGYDFISDVSMGNDGNGRDADATDPGDWVSAGDSCYAGSNSNSSWHGTHVAGTIGASTGNGLHVAGIASRVKILPVRVLGKCGGWTSDIADGVRWAAGIAVAGVATNPNPAKVINLSLGAPGNCSPTMQRAINDARARGAVVVVAAGNNTANLNYQSFTPANCQGVVTVAATGADGDIASYSNIGTAVTLAAPGGEQWNGVWSLGNSGATTPQSYNSRALAGTSMATPHVSGVIALMLSKKPTLVPSQTIDILQESSHAFSGTQYCATAGRCGSGLLNAVRAVEIAMDTDTTGAVDQYKPAPVFGADAQQVMTRASDSNGSCGSITDANSGGGSSGPWSATVLIGSLLAMFLIPSSSTAAKKKAQVKTQA